MSNRSPKDSCGMVAVNVCLSNENNLIMSLPTQSEKGAKSCQGQMIEI